MKFYLDHDRRFQLIARQGGWDLLVDGKRVHYCREPRDALRYASDELIDDADVEGVAEVTKALKDIDERIRRMADIIVTNEMGSLALRYLDLVKDIEDPRECVKAVSLEMSGCQTTLELRADPDHETVVTRAKALLAPMLAARKNA